MASEDVQDILERARELSVNLWVENGQLRFRSRFGTMTDDLRARIMTHRSALVAAWPWTQSTMEELNTTPIFYEDKGLNAFPLLVHQEPIWRVIKSSPTGLMEGFSNLTHLVSRITSSLDTQSMRLAIGKTVVRYPVLAAVIRETPLGPTVILGDPDSLPTFEQYDVSTEPREHRENRAKDIATKTICRRFNLQSGPLFRMFSIKLDKSDFVFGFVVHHLICDGVSVGIIARELARNYELLRRNMVMPMVRPGLSYGDYLRGIKAWLNSQSGYVSRDYWCRLLDGAPPTTLSSRRGDALEEDKNAVIQRFQIARQESDSLRIFAASQSTTLFIVLLAAKILAHSIISRSNDITIGIIIACRSNPRLINVVGWLVNRVHVRVMINQKEPLIDFIRNIGHQFNEGRKHQYYPFELVESLLKNTSSYFIHPIFNFMASYNTKERNINFPIDFPTGRWVNYSHVCQVVSSNAGISGFIRYSPSSLGEEKIRAFLDAISVVLNTFLEGPNSSLESVTKIYEEANDHPQGNRVKNLVTIG